jgi:hypothetical protein
VKALLCILALLTISMISCAIPASETPAEAAQEQTPTPAEPPLQLAKVTLLEVQPYSAQTGTVSLWATGPLPDLCTALGAVTREREGSVIYVTLETQPYEAPVCSDGSPVEFTRVIPISGLEPGEYTVLVNGVQGTFTFGSTDE